MDDTVLSLTVEACRDTNGSPQVRVLRVDRAVDYGRISVNELRYLIEALLPLDMPVSTEQPPAPALTPVLSPVTAPAREVALSMDGAARPIRSDPGDAGGDAH